MLQCNFAISPAIAAIGTIFLAAIPGNFCHCIPCLFTGVVHLAKYTSRTVA